MRYESEADVKTRLYHTVVIHKQRPCLVVGVEDKNTVVVSDLETDKHSKALVADLDLDPSHAPLGYVIDGEDVYMAMRKPVRRYKQGLNNENLVLKNVLDEPPARRMGRLNFASKAIGKTMLGQFPDVGEAFQKVRKQEARIVPFHRDWAVGVHEGEACLVFRGEVVGYVLDESVKLLPERFYLRESLEVALG